MVKPWGTAQYKKKRLAFLEGKTCEWCGSTENLEIRRAKRFNGLQEYKKILTKAINQHFASDENQMERHDLLSKAHEKVKTDYSNVCPKCGFKVYTRKTVVPKFKCQKCGWETDNPISKLSPDSQKEVRKEFRKLFLSSHKDAVDQMFNSIKENSNKEYSDFKNIHVLCRKCNYEKTKGLVICKICRKSYHKPKYEKCWKCFMKTDEGGLVIQGKTISAYNSPWCGKTFQIKKELWEVEANPRMCCIAFCKADSEKCEFAKKYWI